MDIEKGAAWIPFNLMERFMRDVFSGLGVTKTDAAICATVLLKADQLGLTPTASPGSNPSITTASGRASNCLSPPSARCAAVAPLPSSMAATEWATSPPTRP